MVRDSIISIINHARPVPNKLFLYISFYHTGGALILYLAYGRTRTGRWRSVSHTDQPATNTPSGKKQRRRRTHGELRRFLTPTDRIHISGLNWPGSIAYSGRFTRSSTAVHTLFARYLHTIRTIRTIRIIHRLFAPIRKRADLFARYSHPFAAVRVRSHLRMCDRSRPV
jgi:hypothetical protein